MQSLLSHAQVLKYFLRVESKFENLYDFLLREMALLANELQTEFEHWYALSVCLSKTTT